MSNPSVAGPRSGPDGPVRSYTEWDPLEEVVVGSLAGAVHPTWQPSMAGVIPQASWSLFQEKAGTPFPADQVMAAERELDGFVATLQREGVRVVRPDPSNHAAPIVTRNWRTSGGLYAGMPRDHVMVIGETIVEAPMSWRCRYNEGDAYRRLIKSYFQRGAGWLQGPRPQLTDDLFRPTYSPGDRSGWAITEFEPVFDTADFLRFGRDIIVQYSHVTNQFGIDWLQRAIGNDHVIHRIEANDPSAMHIDITIMPLAPGTLLVNPEYYVPNELFRDWTIIEAPKSTVPDGWPMYFCDATWMGMNVLSLDPETVVVERQEEPLIEVLTAHGFQCIPVDFRHVYTFGGSFHCVTLDVRRRGGSGSYLNT